MGEPIQSRNGLSCAWPSGCARSEVLTTERTSASILIRTIRLLRPHALAKPRVKRVLLLLAGGFLIVGLGASLYEHPEILNNLNWLPVVLLFLVAVPFTIIINSIEFMLIGRMVRQVISLRRAIEITILVSAANLLPLPGGAIVRVVALKTGGTHYGKGTTATLLAALIWVGVSLLYAGLWIATHLPGTLSYLFIAGGAGALLVSAATAVQQGYALQATLGLVLVRLALVLLDAARLYLCLLALGIDATFAQASAFAVSGAAGSAVSIVPGGLGIREAVTAVLAPVMGLAAAVGFLAAALNRLIGMPMLVPLALWFSLRGERPEPAGPPFPRMWQEE